MADASGGAKIPLKITPCTLETSGEIKVSGSDFEVMINPSNYTHGFTINNNKKQAPGDSSAETKFTFIKPEKVGFDIVIDGTGVVNPSGSNSGPPDVKTQVEELKTIVYTYVGKDHSPNYVRLLWGSFIFFGTLESMSMDYTLFKPSGIPLRAKVKLAFTGFQSKDEKALRANRSSPDLDHVVEVKAGDTLPLLCYQIYKNSGYYTDVAKANNLVNFRNLVPGTRLHFPPLR